MQTAKSRPGSRNVPKKRSPSKPRTDRNLKTQGSVSDPHSSQSPVRKSPKDGSPTVVEHQSPRTPAAEMKKPSKLSELESQVAHLQEELKRARDQLALSDSSKRTSEQDADEAKIQLATVLAQLDKTVKQLHELSDSEDARIQELRKISHDRDKAWQSEVEAVQKQHSMDSAALASALKEIQWLKTQLSNVSESEASQAQLAESAHREVHNLRVELQETLGLVEGLKSQLTDCRESKEQAFLEEVFGAQIVLEVVKNAEGELNLENGNVMESCKSLLVELEESRDKVSCLEELVRKFQDDIAGAENSECAEMEAMRTEIDKLRNEVSRLRDALENAERSYRDEYLEMTLQIKDANELVNLVKIESCNRESELEARLKESTAKFEELNTNMIDRENALQIASSQIENELELELKQKENLLQDLKSNLLDKEMRLRAVTEENESLKSEILKMETEKREERDNAVATAEAARSAEREALVKLENMTEEAEKSSRKAERLAEEIGAAQATGSEMETELRRLKVQSDQWRKAAEAAAAMLSTGNHNAKFVDRTGSLDCHAIGGKLGSPFSDEELTVKKNGNVLLKKIGVLLKKGQK